MKQRHKKKQTSRWSIWRRNKRLKNSSRLCCKYHNVQTPKQNSNKRGRTTQQCATVIFEDCHETTFSNVQHGPWSIQAEEVEENSSSKDLEPLSSSDSMHSESRGSISSGSSYSTDREEPFYPSDECHRDNSSGDADPHESDVDYVALEGMSKAAVWESSSSEAEDWEALDSNAADSEAADSEGGGTAFAFFDHRPNDSDPHSSDQDTSDPDDDSDGESHSTNTDQDDQGDQSDQDDMDGEDDQDNGVHNQHGPDPDPDDPDPDPDDPDPDPDDPEPDPDDPDPDPDDPDPDPDDPDPNQHDEDSNDNGTDTSDDEPNFSFQNVNLDVVVRSRNIRSMREILAMLLAVSVRDNLTYVSLIRLMKVANATHGRKYFPEDKKLLWTLLGRNDVGVTKYAYCKDFLAGHGMYEDLGDGVVCHCGSVVSKRTAHVFISLNIRKQFSELLAKDDVRASIVNREVRQVRIEGTMEDILDGRQYRALAEGNNILSSVYNYSFTFNLDGFRLAKSSNVEAWPIYVKWNELPWKLRQKYMILAGLWIDVKKPNMNMFLEKFVEQSNMLGEEGVRWRENNGNERISRFAPTCCVVDAQARCAILNMHSPSGHFGCPLCTHPGIYVGGAVHFPHLPPVCAFEKRTDEDIKRCMEEGVGNANGHVLGFKGPSQLMLMDYLDLGKGVVSDDMHPFSGVIEHHTNLLMTRTRDNVPPYYIGSAEHIAQIDIRVLAIRTPTKISRKPRSLKTRKRWKSSEWRNGLLYYCVPCLEGILPRQYLLHIELFAQAIMLLSGENVSPADCDTAERLLLQYVVQFERYFGPENMRYNVHILIHVADCVREWGPTYAHSTSFFEAWNFDLGLTVTSPNASADQIVIRFLIQRFLNSVQENEQISDGIKTIVHNILHSPRLRENLTVGNVVLLGKCMRRPFLDRDNLLFNQNNLLYDYHLQYHRAEVGGVEYRTSEYRFAGEETRSDNSHILTWNDEFGQILSITVLVNGQDRRVVFVISVFNINAFRNRYMSKVAPEEGVLVIASPEDIRCPAIVCTTPHGTYVFPIANTRELD